MVTIIANTQRSFTLLFVSKSYRAMDKSEFKKKSKLIEEIALKHNWRYDSTDSNTYRVSYKDELSIYRRRSAN